MNNSTSAYAGPVVKAEAPAKNTATATMRLAFINPSRSRRRLSPIYRRGSEVRHGFERSPKKLRSDYSPQTNAQRLAVWTLPDDLSEPAVTTPANHGEIPSSTRPQLRLGLAPASHHGLPASGKRICTPSWPHRSEPRHTHPGHVVVDRLHATAHQIRLMPEPSASRIFQELFPPLPMWLQRSPPLQAVQSCQYCRMPVWGGKNDETRSSCSRRPSGCCLHERRICGPRPNNLSKPRGRRTLIPRYTTTKSGYPLRSPSADQRTSCPLRPRTRSKLATS